MFSARVLAATTFYNHKGFELFEKTYILQIENHIKGKGKK